MCIFGLGCGFARSSSQLLVLRGFQGIGGAASITASVSDPSANKLVYKFTPHFTNHCLAPRSRWAFWHNLSLLDLHAALRLPYSQQAPRAEEAQALLSEVS